MKRIAVVLLKLLFLPAQISMLLVGLAGALYWNDHNVSVMVLFAGVAMMALAVKRIGNTWLRF